MLTNWSSKPLRRSENNRQCCFNGHVLPNERTFGAQDVMQNARTDYDMSGGQKVVTGRWTFW